jgi:hypothetical protein
MKSPYNPYDAVPITIISLLNLLPFLQIGIKENMILSTCVYKKRNFFPVIFSYASWYFFEVSAMTCSGRLGGAEL